MSLRDGIRPGALSKHTLKGGWLSPLIGMRKLLGSIPGPDKATRRRVIYRRFHHRSVFRPRSAPSTKPRTRTQGNLCVYNELLRWQDAWLAAIITTAGVGLKLDELQLVRSQRRILFCLFIFIFFFLYFA